MCALLLSSLCLLFMLEIFRKIIQHKEILYTEGNFLFCCFSIFYFTLFFYLPTCEQKQRELLKVEVNFNTRKFLLIPGNFRSFLLSLLLCLTFKMTIISFITSAATEHCRQKYPKHYYCYFLNLGELPKNISKNINTILV